MHFSLTSNSQPTCFSLMRARVTGIDLDLEATASLTSPPEGFNLYLAWVLLLSFQTWPLSCLFPHGCHLLYSSLFQQTQGDSSVYQTSTVLQTCGQSPWHWLRKTVPALQWSSLCESASPPEPSSDPLLCPCREIHPSHTVAQPLSDGSRISPCSVILWAS